MKTIDLSSKTPDGKLIRSLGPFGFIAVDEMRVNLDDLLNSGKQAGSIIRCDGDPSTVITVFAAPESDTIGCVAGWISDEDDV